MSATIKYTRNFSKQLIAVLLIAFAMCFTLPFAAVAEETASISFDNLVPVEDASVAMAYIDPDADFSVFTRVMILEPYVAFRANWQRDQNRSRSSNNVRARDMERIRTDMAAMFKQVFTESLQADDGYEVVDEADYDVLLLRPAIIDLDVTAPDVSSAGRSQTFSASGGAATLYIELFDSVNGTIIGRAADRQASRGSSRMTWSNRVSNSAEARRVLRGWSDQLRSFLDQHYTKK